MRSSKMLLTLVGCCLIATIMTTYAACYSGVQTDCPTYSTASTDCGTGFFTTFNITVTGVGQFNNCIPWVRGNKYVLPPINKCTFSGNAVHPCFGTVFNFPFDSPVRICEGNQNCSG
jgi:hypothetical protein